MKQSLIVLICCLVTIAAHAQLQPTELDKSPLDLSYSPQSYPIAKFQGQKTGKPNARILYSRPQVKGRTIFGGEVKYGEVWRLGANESTEIEFFRDAMIGGKKVLKGRYTMYCIPAATSWTIIINKDLDSWGSFIYNAKLDVLRVSVPVQKNTEPVEAFTMYFDAQNDINILWDDVKVEVPVKFL